MRAEKQLLLDEIKEMFDPSNSIVLASYRQLSPNAAAGFRDNLREQGGCLEVVRKRILIKAAQAAGITLEKDNLAGHIAVIFGKGDPVTTSKLIFQFSKENEDALQILGGRFEGQLCSGKDVEMISQMPPKDEMRAQFLGLLEAPMSQTLAVIETLLSAVLYCLENKAQKGDQ